MSFFSKLKNHLNIPELPDEIPPEREEEIINKLAKQIMSRGMETPALMFIETFKPLGFIAGSLGQAFFSPFLDIFGVGFLSEYMVIFQKRGNIEKLLKKIEELTKKG